MESCLYEGKVRHVRHKSPRRDFGYSMFMVYLDLAELDTVFEGRFFWSARGPNFAWFSRNDHYGDPNVSLDSAIRLLVAERTGAFPAGPIRLLTHLRYFGFCFNPVSFYYCFSRDGRSLEAVVAEVNNTPWGERHMYVLSGDAIASGMAVELDKAFHVSPFFGMDIRYAWRFGMPGDRLSVDMRSDEGKARVFDASLRLVRRPIDGVELSRVLVSHPLITVKIVGAIYWQAFALWAKGAPFFSHPRGNT